MKKTPKNENGRKHIFFFTDAQWQLNRQQCSLFFIEFESDDCSQMLRSKSTRMPETNRMEKAENSRRKKGNPKICYKKNHNPFGCFNDEFLRFWEISCILFCFRSAARFVIRYFWDRQISKIGSKCELVENRSNIQTPKKWFCWLFASKPTFKKG